MRVSRTSDDFFWFFTHEASFFVQIKKQSRKIKKTPKPFPAGRFLRSAKRLRAPRDDAGFAGSY
jgi:hypothetical protein